MAILSSDRTIDWSKAGVWYNASTPTEPWAGTKGIPSFTVDIDLTGLSSYGGHTLDSTGTNDSTEAINDALTACAQGYAVLLGPGTYRVNSHLDITRSRVVLRGSGPGSTIIRGYGTSYILRLGNPSNLGPAVFNQSLYSNVVSGATKDSTSIVVADASNINVGDYVRIDQLNDYPGIDLDPRDVDPNYTVINLRYIGDINAWMGRYGMSGPRTRAAGEHVLVTGKSSNTLTIHRGLHYAYDMSLTPQVGSVARGFVMNSGVENLTLEAPAGTYNNLLNIYCAAWCWARKVEFKNVGYRAFYGEFNAFGLEVSRCFFNGAQLYGGSQGYGVSLQQQCSDCLIEDNISDGLHAPFVCDAGGDGFVFGYNYSRRTYQDSPTNTWFINDMGSHGPHEWFHLWEGNVCGKITFDGYHGSGSHQVAARNWFLGRNDGNTYSTHYYHAAIVEMANHSISFVGNILGESGYAGMKEETPTFSAEHDIAPGTLWKVGYGGYVGAGDLDYTQGTAPDPTCASTIIRHGNYDYASEAIEWEDIIEDRVVPDSYYLSSKPYWFGSLDFPAIGPDISGYVKDIPATVRWNNYVASSTLSDLFADMEAGTPSFTLTVVPTTRTVSAGTTATYWVTVNADDGFTDNVQLSVSGLPVGGAPVFGANPLGPDGTTTMDIDTAGFTPSTLSLKLNGEKTA